MVSEEIQRLRARMDGLVREQADRQELLDRQGKEIQAKGQEYMTKQAQAAEKYLEHRRELGRREREAGGWGTEKSRSDKNNVMGFGPEDASAAEEERYASRSTESLTPRRPEPRPEPQQAQVAHEVPETTDRVASPARERRGRHARREDFDEDDFSNNSYLD